MNVDLDEMEPKLPQPDQKCDDSSEKMKGLITRYIGSPEDCSQLEEEIAKNYSKLLENPSLFDKLNITQHHRIISKALNTLKNDFPYSNFIKMVGKAMNCSEYSDIQSLLIHFDEKDFSSKDINTLKSNPNFQPDFLYFRPNYPMDFLVRPNKYEAMRESYYIIQKFVNKIIEVNVENALLKCQISNLQTNNIELQKDNEKEKESIKKLQEEIKNLKNGYNNIQTRQNESASAELKTVIPQNSESQSNSQNYIIQIENSFKLQKELLEAISQKVDGLHKTTSHKMLSNIKKQLETILANTNSIVQAKNQSLANTNTNVQATNQRLDTPENSNQTLTSLIESVRRQLNNNQEGNYTLLQQMHYDIEEIKNSFGGNTTNLEEIKSSISAAIQQAKQNEHKNDFEEIRKIIEIGPGNFSNTFIKAFNDLDQKLQNKVDSLQKALQEFYNGTQYNQKHTPNNKVISNNNVEFMKNEFIKLNEIRLKQNEIVKQLKLQIVNLQKEANQYKDECEQYKQQIESKFEKESKEILENQLMTLTAKYKELETQFNKLKIENQTLTKEASQVAFKNEMKDIITSIKTSIDTFYSSEKAQQNQELENQIRELTMKNHQLSRQGNLGERLQFDSKLISFISKRQADLRIVNDAIQKDSTQARKDYIVTQIQGLMMYQDLIEKNQQQEKRIEELTKEVEKINELKIWNEDFSDEQIWQNLYDRFNSKMPKNEHRNAQKLVKIRFPYVKEFNGIITYMKNHYYEIKITASSIDINSHEFSPYHVIDYSQNKIFCSQNIPNSWIQFDFGQRKVCLSHYLIQSVQNQNLRSWRIEGSNDKTHWFILDTQQACQDLNDQGKICGFQLASLYNDSYSCIRLYQIGPNSSGTDYLSFNSIEFFGDLIEVK